MSEPVSYEAASKELEVLVAEIESGNVSIDALVDKVQRASDLLAFCENKIKSTQDNLEAILNPGN